MCNTDIQLNKSITGGAKWIWSKINPRPVNCFRLFRKEFILENNFNNADILVFAEWRYKLYINGEFIQIGPTPCLPEHRLVDKHNIKDYLHVGKNCISLIVYCPGVMTGQWTIVNPALIAEISINKGEKILFTDKSWKTNISDAWKSTTQLCNYSKGFHEWHIMGNMPDDWNKIGFDDSAWDYAVELPFYSYGDFCNFKENYIGYATLNEYKPINIVTGGLADGIITEQMCNRAKAMYTAARNRWRIQMGYWNLGFDGPLPVGEALPEPVAELASMEKHIISKDIIVILNEGRDSLFPIKLEASDKGDPFIVFDFGVVRSGLFKIEVESTSGGILDVAWDDRINDDGIVPLYRATPNCDRVELKEGFNVWEGFFERGLRYVQLIFRKHKGVIVLYNLCIKETLTAIAADKTAKFESSNKLLEDIWQASLITVRNYLTGCGAGDPIRERCHWIHDDSMASRMAFYCYNDWKTWRRGIELTGQSQRNDGAFPVVAPGHFEDFNMVNSSCYWVVEVAEYFKHTGDTEFTKEMFSKIVKFINYQLRFADYNGLLYETPGRRFLSWADGVAGKPYKSGEIWAKKDRKSWGDFFDPPTLGYNSIINTYWLWCLKEASSLASALSYDSHAERYKKMFDSGRKAFDEYFWENDIGLYRDNLAFDSCNKKNSATFCESTLFSMYRADLIEREKGIQCYDTIMKEDFICNRSSGGLELGSVPVFLLKTGRTKQAIDLYLDIWGNPIKAGATTCGEQFYRSGGNSDCHIHGATPARDFLEYLAGIRIISPFWDDVLLVPPKDADNLPDIRATVPTPKGNIDIKIVNENGVKKYLYIVPDISRCFVLKDEKIMESNNKGELCVLTKI